MILITNLDVMAYHLTSKIQFFRKSKEFKFLNLNDIITTNLVPKRVEISFAYGAIS